MLEERRVIKNQAALLPVKKKKKKVSRGYYRKMIERMPGGSELIMHNVSWEEYKTLLQDVGEASGWRISYNEGEMRITVLSAKHENYSRLVQMMIGILSLRLGIKILSFGAMTMKKGEEKGAEADSCFYIQKASFIGNKDKIDLQNDPPPDVVVEIDIHHKSDNKFEIYAALGVPEFWLYDGKKITFYELKKGKYIEIKKSKALPVLTSKTMTKFLNQSRIEGQYETLLAFEEWLNTLKR